jgi:hypothetical protein
LSQTTTSSARSRTTRLGAELDLGDDGTVVDVGGVVEGEARRGEGGDGALALGEDEPQRVAEGGQEVPEGTADGGLGGGGAGVKAG